MFWGSDILTGNQTDDDIFANKERWDAYLGSFFALPVNEEGANPQTGQYPQGDMQPHISYMRQLANMFAAEAQIPVHSLLYTEANPTSADAIEASRNDLIEKVKAAFWGSDILTGNQTRISVSIPDHSSPAVRYLALIESFGCSGNHGNLREMYSISELLSISFAFAFALSSVRRPSLVVAAISDTRSCFGAVTF